jgi:hypothetical protein
LIFSDPSKIRTRGQVFTLEIHLSAAQIHCLAFPHDEADLPLRPFRLFNQLPDRLENNLELTVVLLFELDELPRKVNGNALGARFGSHGLMVFYLGIRAFWP